MYYSNQSAWVCPNIVSPENGLFLFKIETFHFIDDFHCDGYPEQTEKSIPTMLILSSYLLFYHFLVPHSSVPQNKLVRIPTVFWAPMGCMEKFEALQHLSQVEGYISKGVTICNLKHRKWTPHLDPTDNVRVWFRTMIHRQGCKYCKTRDISYKNQYET
jgi:hypothetical protein